MGQVPRDPRQLARDILAGKISIEELARQQQQRRGGGAVQRPQAQQQARVPERIPLPRTTPVPPPPRPVARPAPQRQAPRQPPPVVVPTAQQRRQQSRPIAEPPPVHAVQAAQPTKRYSEPHAAIGETKAVVVDRAIEIQRLGQSRTALRQCLVMAEVLGKPLALRDDF